MDSPTNRSRLRVILALGAVLVASALATTGCGDDDPTVPDPRPQACKDALEWPSASPPDSFESTGVGVGDFARRVDGVDQCGEEIDLDRFYGSMVVLEFAASWCPACQADAAVAQADFEAMREAVGTTLWRLCVLAGDNVYTEEAEAVSSSWAHEHGLTFPVMSGPWAVVSGGDYAVRVFPTFVILDPEFRIRARLTGFDSARLRAETVVAWETYQSEQEVP